MFLFVVALLTAPCLSSGNQKKDENNAEQEKNKAADDEKQKEEQKRKECEDKVAIACGRLEPHSLHTMDRRQCCLTGSWLKCRAKQFKKHCESLKELQLQTLHSQLETINDADSNDNPCRKWAPLKVHKCFTGGAIAGIAIGGIVGLALIASLVVYACKRCG